MKLKLFAEKFHLLQESQEIMGISEFCLQVHTWQFWGETYIINYYKQLIILQLA